MKTATRAAVSNKIFLPMTGIIYVTTYAKSKRGLSYENYIKIPMDNKKFSEELKKIKGREKKPEYLLYGYDANMSNIKGFYTEQELKILNHVFHAIQKLNIDQQDIFNNKYSECGDLIKALIEAEYN